MEILHIRVCLKLEIGYLWIVVQVSVVVQIRECLDIIHIVQVISLQTCDSAILCRDFGVDFDLVLEKTIF